MVVTKMKWSRPKRNGRDQNELVRSKEFFRTCNVLPFGCTPGRRAKTVVAHLRGTVQIVMFVLEIKTFTKNWDSKTPSVGIILT